MRLSLSFTHAEDGLQQVTLKGKAHLVTKVLRLVQGDMAQSSDSQ